jgi:hypothetical protein
MAAYPPRFGPVYWKVIHLTGKRLDAFASQPAPTDHAEKLWAFLHGLDAHLPCGMCVSHFLQFLGEHPLPTVEEVCAGRKDGTSKDAETYFHWTVDLHNHANEASGKVSISYIEANDAFQRDWNDVAENQRLSESQRVRLEDQAKIRQLQEELKQKTSSTPLIVLMVLCGLLCVCLFVCLWVLARRH